MLDWNSRTTRPRGEKAGTPSGSGGSQANGLFVLRLLICEALAGSVRKHQVSDMITPRTNTGLPSGDVADWVKNLRNIFPKLPTNHLLSNLDLLICLPIVNSEAQAHEIGQDGRRTLLGADRGRVWWWGESARKTKTGWTTVLARLPELHGILILDSTGVAGWLGLRWLAGGFHVRDDVRAWLSGLVVDLVGMSIRRGSAGSYLSRPSGLAGRAWETWWACDCPMLRFGEVENTREIMSADL